MKFGCGWKGRKDHATLRTGCTGGDFILRKGIFYTFTTVIAMILVYLMSFLYFHNFAGHRIVSVLPRTQYFLLTGYAVIFGILYESKALFSIFFERRIRFHWTVILVILGAMLVSIPFWDWALFWFGPGDQNFWSTITFPLHWMPTHLLLSSIVGSSFIRSLRKP